VTPLYSPIQFSVISFSSPTEAEKFNKTTTDFTFFKINKLAKKVSDGYIIEKSIIQSASEAWYIKIPKKCKDLFKKIYF